MKMNSTEASSFTSPLSARMKNSTTPLRSKRKTSRRDMGLNVNASCSTPKGHRLGTLNACFNSPTGSIPCSQDSPDVVWDYTSPKLPKGAKRREINITIEEFLKNLNQKQIPDCSSQASHHIKLLEKWMAHQTTVATTKNIHKTVKVESKKRSKRVIAEIKQFMESIQNRKQDSASEEPRKVTELQNNDHDVRIGNILSTSSNIDKKSFIEGASGSDSADELWGDFDSSFMVKATQLLEDTNAAHKNQNLDLISTIPETVPSAEVLNPRSLVLSSNVETPTKANRLNTLQKQKDLENQTEYILTQLLNCEWDSDSEDNWDNGFILEDDDLSQIPEEVLSGNIAKSNVADCTNKQKESCAEPCDIHLNDIQFEDELFEEELKEMSTKNKTCTTSSKDAPIVSSENNSAEIFNNFDDVNFDDESILCKPEVLSWIDEVENQLTQKGSQEGPKCTPEEIRKKKDEALQRRKNKQLSSKGSSK